MFGTKKKLMTAVVMLVISAIMMTTASYAWFTISTKPEITDLTTQVVVNENLEIALAMSSTILPESLSGLTSTDKQYTWGNVINLSTNGGSAYTNYRDLKKVLRPATNSGGTFMYPTYGSDGRISNITGVLSPSDGVASDGFGNLTDGSKVYGYYVDFWVRTNVGGTLALQTEAGHKRSTSGEATGLGSYFQSNAANTADQTLAKNISIAFEDITPNITGAEEKAGTAKPITATKKMSSPSVIEVDSSGGKMKITFIDTSIVTLTANHAKLIRMYVFLEGANVTNASASLGTNSGGSSGDLNGYKVGGSLNVQFTIAGVDESMDAQP